MAQTLKQKIEKNIPWLDGYQKGKDAQDIKKGAQGILSMMETDDISKFNEDLLKYMDHAEKFKEKFEKNEDLKIQDTFKTFQKIEKLYEDKNKKQTIQESSKDEDLRRKEPSKSVEKTIKKPTTVVKKHEQATKTSNHDIHKLEQNINNFFTQLSAQIQALGNATVIKKGLENLQADLSYKIKKQYEDRKDIYEELETLPVTLKNLSTKVDSIQIPSSTGSSVKLEIPKDEQAVVDLTRFMKDGLDQFENIARYYITKQSEFDKSDKLNKSNQDALIESKKVGIKEGKELERINVATEIFNKFPEKFDDVKSVFEDIVTEEYKAGDEIEITQEDRQKLEIKISGIKEVGKITIELPAVLIGGEIVKKATIKEGN